MGGFGNGFDGFELARVYKSYHELGSGSGCLAGIYDFIHFFIKKSVGQLASNPSRIAIRGRLGRR